MVRRCSLANGAAGVPDLAAQKFALFFSFVDGRFYSGNFLLAMVVFIRGDRDRRDPLASAGFPKIKKAILNAVPMETTLAFLHTVLST